MRVMVRAYILRGIPNTNHHQSSLLTSSLNDADDDDDDHHHDHGDDDDDDDGDDDDNGVQCVHWQGGEGASAKSLCNQTSHLQS